jgi:hypothetical protein
MNGENVCLKVLRVFNVESLSNKMIKVRCMCCISPDLGLKASSPFVTKLWSGDSFLIQMFSHFMESTTAYSHHDFALSHRGWTMDISLITYLSFQSITVLHRFDVYCARGHGLNLINLFQIAQVAEGLRYLHELEPSIIHADVKGVSRGLH